MKVNNVAEIREALEDSQSLLESFSWGEYGAQVRGQMRDNQAALSAPPRNCDVGTAEEQEERFARYCIVQTCGTCPCFVKLTNGDWRCNPFAWAQMPYEATEGGDNESK